MKKYLKYLIKKEGFSLIELMVAMVITLLVVYGVSTLYVSSKQAYRIDDRMSRLQETGRFVASLVASDIRMTRFRGCSAGASPLNNTLNAYTSPDPRAYSDNFTDPLQGFYYTGGAWTPAVLDASITGAIPAPDINSDVITVRRATGAGFPLVAPMLTSSDNVTVAAGNRIQQNDIVLISSCTGAAIFQVTNADANSTGVLQHVVQAGQLGPPSSPGNVTNNLGTVFGANATDAEVVRIDTVTYYIAASGIQPPQLQTANMSLWRIVGTNVPVELAEGVERMSILYGVDTNGDRSPDIYVPANNVNIAANFSNVVSVQIFLLLTTVDDYLLPQPQPAFNFGNVLFVPTDRKIRKVFSSVVAFR
ncbi:MAG: PilW family protein [Nitrospiria bacterium]